MFSLRIAQEQELCKQCEESGLVDVTQFRLMLRSRLISEAVIDDKGNIDGSIAKAVINTDFPHYSLLDTFFTEHVKRVLSLFSSSKMIQLKLRQLSFPLANPWVDQLIRASVLKKKSDQLSKRDISIAILLAILMPVRQGVGSCFATAPLIHLQRVDPEYLFIELYEVMTRGSLKKICGGEEKKVPLAIKTGIGDLLKVLRGDAANDPILQELFDYPPRQKFPQTVKGYLEEHAKDPIEIKELFKAHTQSPLMKCFEYTLAAFSDFNIGFSKWNFATALGFSHEDIGGVGSILYRFLEEKLDESNQKVAEYAEQINSANHSIRTNESLFRSSGDVSRLHRYKTEIQTQVYRLNTYEGLYEAEATRREGIAGLYKFIIEHYQSLFPHYFQEIYDPEMFSESDDLFVDSPAGFRLTYKHGRYDPMLWSIIINDEDFIDHLSDFFRLTEPILLSYADFHGADKLIEECISEMIRHIDTKKFLAFSRKRILEMHKKYLPGGQTVSPYAYISGGSLTSLMQSYLSMEEKVIGESFLPKNPEDLAIMLLEILKDLPYTETEKFEKEFWRGMLITNPIHAFVLLPGSEKFREGWLSTSANTHTFVRDEFIHPYIAWYHACRFSPSEVQTFFPFLKLHELPIECAPIDLYSHLEKSVVPEESWAPVFFFFLFQKGLPKPIVFADSNWLSDFFAFMVHPKTHQLEIFRYSGHYLHPISFTHKFFTETSWTIFPLIDREIEKRSFQTKEKRA